MLENADCFRMDLELFVLYVVLAGFNGLLAAIAFFQLVRIHMRNQQSGWARQKVLHLMIGCSNLGYFLYFTSTLIATSKQWFCWSNVCGFILMAYPKILLLAAFLLMLSFWVDLCHQANDEEEEDDDDSGIQHVLLENSKSNHRLQSTDGHRSCCSFPSIHIGSHQKFVIVVVGFVLILMISFSVVIWIGAGKNPIDSSTVAQVYEDFLALSVLLLAGGLGFYGGGVSDYMKSGNLLLRKLRTVRSEKASSDMWKVGGLAVTSVVCFTSSALVALLTVEPLYDPWSLEQTYRWKALVFLMLYYFIGSWVPSAFVLWFMRELPPPITHRRQEQSRTIAFISHVGAGSQHPRQWPNITTSTTQESGSSHV